MSKVFDLIVIGTGITGLAAARQALRDGLSTATLESQFFGGLVMNVNHLDGEIEGSGSDVSANLMMEVSDLGAESINAAVGAIRREADMLVLTSDAGSHRARAVIIASGARLKRLGVPGEAELIDMGVSQCADCDGPLYRNKDVVVVGGGDSALQEAAVLAEYTGHVHLVHRGPSLRASQPLIDRLTGHANVSILWNTRVEAVLGTLGVQAVRVRSQDGADSAMREIPCAGLFAYVGLEPACDFVPDAILRDAAGFLLTDADMHTAMPGVYAAGAVRSGYGGMLTHAVAEGIAAAKSAGASINA